ncbi:RagB/SusD family nutrient uptake outer membrane protein [Pontibacter qinzhouensis]|uniref:RagB/SusD family nutrient uptake outer membrane protein n=1 Tax=Pontibacter qinzhouensis TaxID=2603253 RepID=A0A5C8KBB6_9BACT|nr:RagB/SusD family nutrient uptake outer membrane protein [Pontibacter qinzhouensis]TXK48994.1 RagB/SusD family nutrient uptake outer membrane protein [Pontibacter qinzhouensis]
MKLKIITIGLLLSLGACKEDFLEVSPENFISSNNYFQTEADFTQAVNATYAPLRIVYGGAYIMGEMRSDNTHYIFNNSNRGNLVREEIADFMDNPTAAPVQEKWMGNYRIISYANQVLSRIDAATFADNVKGNLKGQVLFLRALAYFDLVQYFGDVPLLLEPTFGAADEILNVHSTRTRTPKAEVYAQIIKDATDAAALLPAKDQQERGRATSGAAKTLLGNVYVVQKQWAQAETVLKEVVTSGKYSLLTDYAAFFDPANKNNVESVFEVQYLQGNLGLQSNFAYVFMPNLANLTPIVGFVFNNQNTGGWNIPTDNLIAAYEPGDTRKAASIAEGYIAADGNFVAQPYVKKYLHLPLPQPNGSNPNTNENWPVYRYSEVLLLLAEALNEQGKGVEALPYLNQVRDRAFGAGVSPVTVTGQEALRTAIMQERRVELAFENKRWLDLVRTDKALEVMTAYGAALKASGKYPNLLPGSYNVTANKLLFPVPFTEVLVNPNLQ